MAIKQVTADMGAEFSISTRAAVVYGRFKQGGQRIQAREGSCFEHCERIGGEIAAMMLAIRISIS